MKTKSRSNTPSRFALNPLTAALRATALAAALAPVAALAQQQNPPDFTLPTLGVVAAGDISIGEPVNGAMTIIQDSNNAILNWQTFNIGANATLNFDQPHSSAVVLNRVVGLNGTTQASMILGQMNANGRVFLINPSGVTFGQGSSVDVGSLIVTTASIADEDFLAFTPEEEVCCFIDSSNENEPDFRQLVLSGAPAGSLIRVESGADINIYGFGGQVALLAERVEVAGSIEGFYGAQVALAAGRSFLLTDRYGDISYDITEAATSNTAGVSLESTGSVATYGGRIELGALTSGNLASAAVNLQGLVRASNFSSNAGDIYLVAETTNPAYGGDIVLGDTATLDVSGGYAGNILLRADQDIQLNLGADVFANSITQSGFVDSVGTESYFGASGGNVAVVAGRDLIFVEADEAGSTQISSGGSVTLGAKTFTLTDTEAQTNEINSGFVNGLLGQGISVNLYGRNRVEVEYAGSIFSSNTQGHLHLGVGSVDESGEFVASSAGDVVFTSGAHGGLARFDNYGDVVLTAGTSTGNIVAGDIAAQSLRLSAGGDIQTGVLTAYNAAGSQSYPYHGPAFEAHVNAGGDVTLSHFTVRGGSFSDYGDLAFSAGGTLDLGRTTHLSGQSITLAAGESIVNSYGGGLEGSSFGLTVSDSLSVSAQGADLKLSVDDGSPGIEQIVATPSPTGLLIEEFDIDGQSALNALSLSARNVIIEDIGGGEHALAPFSSLRELSLTASAELLTTNTANSKIHLSSTITDLRLSSGSGDLSVQSLKGNIQEVPLQYLDIAQEGTAPLAQGLQRATFRYFNTENESLSLDAQALTFSAVDEESDIRLFGANHFSSQQMTFANNTTVLDSEYGDAILDLRVGSSLVGEDFSLISKNIFALNRFSIEGAGATADIGDVNLSTTDFNNSSLLIGQEAALQSVNTGSLNIDADFGVNVRISANNGLATGSVTLASDDNITLVLNAGSGDAVINGDLKLVSGYDIDLGGRINVVGDNSEDGNIEYGDIVIAAYGGIRNFDPDRREVQARNASLSTPVALRAKRDIEMSYFDTSKFAHGLSLDAGRDLSIFSDDVILTLTGGSRLTAGDAVFLEDATVVANALLVLAGTTIDMDGTLIGTFGGGPGAVIGDSALLAALAARNPGALPSATNPHLALVAPDIRLSDGGIFATNQQTLNAFASEQLIGSTTPGNYILIRTNQLQYEEPPFGSLIEALGLEIVDGDAIPNNPGLLVNYRPFDDSRPLNLADLGTRTIFDEQGMPIEQLGGLLDLLDVRNSSEGFPASTVVFGGSGYTGPISATPPPRSVIQARDTGLGDLDPAAYNFGETNFYTFTAGGVSGLDALQGSTEGEVADLSTGGGQETRTAQLQATQRQALPTPPGGDGDDEEQVDDASGNQRGGAKAGTVTYEQSKTDGDDAGGVCTAGA